MTRHEVNYNALASEPRNPFVVQQMPPDDGETEDDVPTDTDNDDMPRDSGLMIHVVPDTSKARWNHIEDLDSFFTRMYNYHQKHGFAVMMLQEFFELMQFAFVVVFAVFLCYGVNYPVLFGDEKIDKSKIKISDTLYSTDATLSAISGLTWLILSITILFWVFRSIKVMYHAVQYWDVKKFYNTALKIDDLELDNLTWHEVQRKIRDVQSEQQMCIHKQNLTELDIYHRILRFKNYMVAMMNKNLIPAKMCVPLMGECVVFSRGLKYSIELILFRGPWSPFENNWHLKEDFKRSNRRIELAQKLSRQIAWIALAHFLLSPLIFLWALMMFFFSYADLIKREPGTLGIRCWSQYGMLYMRHFNELDHELSARLNRAYRPAVKYMSTFSSPLMAVIAGNVVFICGGILTVLILLTVYDEEVLQVEHVFTIISVLTMVVVAARVFIPDENLIFCPENLMNAVLANTHYLPITWRGLAHTTRVREQFGQFFQYRCTYLINELLSPLITPYVLMFYFRPRSLDLVDFFRNFTVAVVGVGDVCSFAQMDVRKHGNPDWQPAAPAAPPTAAATAAAEPAPTCETNQYTQGEHGKTELSLMHFTLTNPGWKMPSDARQFVHDIRRHAFQDLDTAQRTAMQPAALYGGADAPPTATAMEQSLYMVNSMGGGYSSVVQSAINTQRLFGAGNMQTSSQCSYGLRNPFAGTETQQRTAVDLQQQQQQQQQQMQTLNAAQRPTASYDFQHMLNQNMSMEGDAMMLAGPHRSSLLDNIQEHGEDGQATTSARAADAGGMDGSVVDSQRSSMLFSSVRGPAVGGGVGGTSVGGVRQFQNMLGASMGASSMGGLSKREGPVDGSQEGLLRSVFGRSADVNPDPDADVTATDMCLSTLYLHELHHRQIRRRGLAADQRCRPSAQSSSMWQQRPPTGGGGGGHGGGNASQSFVTPSSSSSNVQHQHAMPSGEPSAEKTPLLSAAKKS